MNTRDAGLHLLETPLSSDQQVIEYPVIKVELGEATHNKVIHVSR